MVGRLVEDQHVDAVRDELGQGRPAAFAAGELVHGLMDLIADQAEAAQKIAHRLLVGVGVVVRPDGADHGFRAVELLEMLIVVAELDEMALRDGP